jgi:glutamate/tyrosine decarboxylase-like PLP-dependent enzyme
MKKTILELQKKSGSLEPDLHIRKSINKAGNQFSNEFYDSLASQKAYTEPDADGINRIMKDPLGEEPIAMDELLKFVEAEVASPGLNTTSGNHFGYIPGGGLFTSAVGDYIAAVTNRYAGVFFASPGAAALETRLINWMAGMIGYSKGAGGYLASGGSMANMTAIHAARDTAGLKAIDFANSVVYLSSQTHHCVARALNICGLSECKKRYISLDERFRMKPEALEHAIAEDRAKGLNPWLIVASAGTTDLGAIDPLEKIGMIARQEGLWYHVDAAYGGFFLLADEGREKLKGISMADSVVLDPHKGMFLPYGSGALVVKDVSHLAKAHNFDANYMQDARIGEASYSPSEISPELSKHFRGLRLWFPLKLHGTKAFKSALEEKLLLSRYAWEKMRKMKEIEVSSEPELTTFTFRWKPKGKEKIWDDINHQLHQAILEEGEVFLSTTKMHDHFWFRMTILSVRTHLEEVERFLEAIQRNIKNIQATL